MPDITTIKVAKSVRTRISAAARSRNESANEFIAQLLADWERRERMAAVRDAMSASSAADVATYQDEVTQWDQTSADGESPSS